MGHNTRDKIVSEIMKQASFEGYYTNHSLGVTSATCLFNAEVDEQLITATLAQMVYVLIRGHLINSSS